MFKNLIRYSLRSFKRQRAYIIINILGLSIGIACSLLISFLYSMKQVMTGSIPGKEDFQVDPEWEVGKEEYTSALPLQLLVQMLKEFPEVEDFLRMTRRMQTDIEYNSQTFTEDHLVEADSSFFNFFSIPVLKGDPENLLNAPRKVVLSESTAKKLFGDENPIDKTIKIGSDTIRYTVSGVMADIPENSHFEASMLLHL